MCQVLWTVEEPGCVHRGVQGGASNQSGGRGGGGGHRDLHCFNIKMWLTIKYSTILVPKTQLNTINLYLIVIEIFVNYYIK